MTPEFAAPLFEPERLAVLLALSFFFGLAFEEYFARSRIKPPGGVRTFPLVSLAGALLYALEPKNGVLLLGGMLILGAWLAIYYYERLVHQHAETDDEELVHGPSKLDAGIMAPVCNLLAFLLGPVTLAAPLWVAVGIAVVAVLLMSARERLHSFAATLRAGEIVTLGKFLIIIGIVLPLVPDTPVTSLTAITPYQVWLAVVAVSSLSYASYLMQRFIAPNHGVLISAALGGLYSSTATTVVLSRRTRDMKTAAPRLQAAIVLATAIMFLRILTVVAIFSTDLALVLLPAIAILCPLGLVLCFALMWGARGTSDPATEVAVPTNPLELSTALVFAALFIALSIAVAWAKTRFGESGLFALGALAGFTDVDPFVLNLAQGARQGGNLTVAASAILVAASANNFLKASYTLAFAGRTKGLKPALALFVLALAGVAAAASILGWL